MQPLKQRIEELVAHRKASLQRLQHDIGAHLYEAVQAKIEYEQAALAELAVAEETVLAKKKRAAASLRSEYFILKRLDKHLI